MVLGSLVKGLGYPKFLYYTGKAHGFGYLPKTLVIEPGAWDDEAGRWLAGIFGLVYQRTLPPHGTPGDRAWNDYLGRIEHYLKAGLAVQTTRGWLGAREEQGRILSGMGDRMFWWEGMSRRSRPDMHYFTIVGLDRDAGEAIMNDPIFGWFGSGREMPIKLTNLRRAVEKLVPQHRYITIAFNPGPKPGLSGEQIEVLLKKRLAARAAGDDSVYDSTKMWAEFFNRPARRGFEHGVKSIRSFRQDLEPQAFAGILALKLQKMKMAPLDTISWLDLNVYHQAWITMTAAEYLEEEGRLAEWEWVYRQALLFHELNIQTKKLRAFFATEKNLDRAVAKSRGILVEMQKILTRIEEHMAGYAP